MPINSKHKGYAANLAKWQLVRSFTEEKPEELKKLLRKIDPDDKSVENIARNKEYQEGAILQNTTKRTHDGMMGGVYRKDPAKEIPSSIEYLAEDVNGSGVNIVQFSKSVFSNTMQTGRDGILVDFPPSDDEEPTIASTEENQAIFIEYKAEQIINWKTRGGKLCLVVLEELYEKAVDEFESEDATQWRELALISIGGRDVYTQRIWREKSVEVPLKSNPAITETMTIYAPLTEPIIVTDYNGNTFEEITFTFVGTVNNDSKLDPSLLWSIAEINKGHYRNSADLEENCFLHGQLTLGITSNLSSDEWKELNPNGVKVGARKGVYLGETGGFHHVQAEANQLADNLMKRKEEQMVAIGARLISDGNSGNVREVGVLAKVGAETATLSSLAHNVSDAIKRCLEWAIRYMSPVEQDVEFTLNQDFFPKNFDAQQVMAVIQLYDRNRIAESDLLQLLKDSGLVNDKRTIEEINEENEIKDPLEIPQGMNFGQ